MLRHLLWATISAAVVGPASVTAGVWLIAGAGWALIVFGAVLLALAGFVLLADVVPDPEVRS